MLGRRADFHEEDEPVREAKPVDLLSRTCLDNTPLVTGKGSQEVLACSFGRRGYVVVPPDKGLNGPGAIADRLPEPLHSRVPTNVLLFWIEGPGIALKRLDVRIRHLSHLVLLVEEVEKGDSKVPYLDI